MVNDLVANAKRAILAWASKPLAMRKASAESVTVARWVLPASVLDPFGLPSEKVCTWRNATPIDVVC